MAGGQRGIKARREMVIGGMGEGGCRDVPDTQSPGVAACLLLEKLADLLDLGAARGGIEEQVAQLTRVGFDVDGTLGGPRIALQHQHLVLGPDPLREGVHGCGFERRLSPFFSSTCPRAVDSRVPTGVGCLTCGRAVVEVGWWKGKGHWEDVISMDVIRPKVAAQAFDTGRQGGLWRR